MSADSFVDNMRAYAPRMILDLAATAPKRLLSPRSENRNAAVLFADWVGFSGLVEEMTRGDAQRVVALAAGLDDTMGRLVDRLLDGGGDILKFAGDAVFVMWPAEEDLSRAVAQAATCAREIQTAVTQEAGVGEVSLALRIVVAAGDLHVATIGGVYRHWEVVIAGDPIAQISRLGGSAEPGTVLLSPEAASALRAGGRMESSGGRAVLTPVPPPPLPSVVALDQEGLEALLSFLPTAVATRPELGTDEDAELRPVTTMFVLLRDLLYPRRASVDEVQQALQIVQECIYDHDGALNRFGVDDKGAVALAAWGLPPEPPATEVLLPVRAAIALRRRLREVGLDARVGLTFGTVFCGSIGNARRCEYTVHGRSVNLAARLMMHADTILCDAAVAAGAGGAIPMERMTPLRTKGRPDRVDVFQPASGGAGVCSRGIELA